eukprot:3727958-Alexandrium_andersonii.AAC.1
MCIRDRGSGSQDGAFALKRDPSRDEGGAGSTVAPPDLGLRRIVGEPSELSKDTPFGQNDGKSGRITGKSRAVVE